MYYEESLRHWSAYGFYKKLCKFPTKNRRITFRRALRWKHMFYDENPINNDLFMRTIRDWTTVEKLGLLACRKGDFVLLLWSVKHGFDTRKILHSIETVSGMAFAGEHGHLNIIKYLVHSVHDDKDDGGLRYACKGGHIRIVRFLIRNKIEFPSARCAFWYACRAGHLNVVKYLVKHGCDPKADPDGLRFAISNRYLDVVKFLIEHGGCQPDINWIRSDLEWHRSQCSPTLEYLASIGYPDLRVSD